MQYVAIATFLVLHMHVAKRGNTPRGQASAQHC